MAAFGRLTAKQRAAAIALAHCLTLGEAAKEAGVSLRTLRRWRRYPDFRKAAREAQIEVFRDGLRLLLADQQGNLTALLVLRQRSDNEAIKLRAALGLEAALARRYELALLDDLSSRLDDLEASIEGQANAEAIGGTPGEPGDCLAESGDS